MKFNIIQENQRTPTQIEEGVSGFVEICQEVRLGLSVLSSVGLVTQKNPGREISTRGASLSGGRFTFIRT